MGEVRDGVGGDRRRDQICFRKMTQVVGGRGVTSEGKLDRETVSSHPKQESVQIDALPSRQRSRRISQATGEFQSC